MSKWPEVKCPTCKKRGPWLDGPYGPFCSRRCKLVDLGKWLNEEHVLSEPLDPEHRPNAVEPAEAEPSAAEFQHRTAEAPPRSKGPGSPVPPLEPDP